MKNFSAYNSAMLVADVAKKHGYSYVIGLRKGDDHWVMAGGHLDDLATIFDGVKALDTPRRVEVYGSED